MQPSCPETTAPIASWENGIQIITLDVTEGAAGAPTTIRIVWTTDRNIHSDYNIYSDYIVFVQALNVGGDIVAQIDRQPQDGDHPTSTWRPRDCIAEVYHIDDMPPSAQRLILGLYDAQLQRLHLSDGEDYLDLLER